MHLEKSRQGAGFGPSKIPCSKYFRTFIARAGFSWHRSRIVLPSIEVITSSTATAMEALFPMAAKLLMVSLAQPARAPIFKAGTKHLQRPQHAHAEQQCWTGPMHLHVPPAGACNWTALVDEKHLQVACCRHRHSNPA